MLDAVVDVEVAQVERAGPVVPVQHVCGVLGDEEAERRGQVVRFANASVEFPERDSATAAGNDTWEYGKQ